ncbi:MAG: M48 family metalloprotease [Myxococcota bacterium]
MPRHTSLLLPWLAFVLAACGSSGGGGGGYLPWTPPADTSEAPDVASTPDTPPQQVADEWTGWAPKADAAAPELTVDAASIDIQKPEEPTDLFQEAAAQCAVELVDAETAVVKACKHSTAHTAVLSWAVKAASEQIQSDARLPGKDWPAVLGVAPYTSLGDQVLDAYTCSVSPLWVFDDPPIENLDPAASMNAFAMPDAVWMLDPLLSAMAESAAWYDKVQELHGSPLPEAAGEQLAVGITTVFAKAFAGDHWTVVPKAEVDQRLKQSLFAKDVYAGAVAFVLFHEIGHANLNHGLIQCVIRKGIVDLLKQRNIEPTPEQMKEIQADLSQLTRNAEVQADIYALTMLKSLGFGKQGPTVFAMGLLGFKLLQCQAKGVPDYELQGCALTDFDYKTSHPPMGERIALIQKIFDNGEDLTGLLVPTALKDARSKACGNGICEATESWITCEPDCPTTCGDGKCQGSESPQTCAKDCGAPPPVCGDGKCEPPEVAANCAKDCGPVVACGDLTCNGNETAQSCPDDCDPVTLCINIKCSPELGACQGNLGCATLMNCTAACTTDACIDGCWNKTPSAAQQLYMAAVQCAEDQGCIAPSNPGGDSCQGMCGLQSGACYCDAGCTQNGDCCADYATSCAATGSCAGKCGGAGTGGCQCDDQCGQYGDCCTDKAYYCG